MARLEEVQINHLTLSGDILYIRNAVVFGVRRTQDNYGGCKLWLSSGSHIGIYPNRTSSPATDFAQPGTVSNPALNGACLSAAGLPMHTLCRNSVHQPLFGPESTHSRQGYDARAACTSPADNWYLVRMYSPLSVVIGHPEGVDGEHEPGSENALLP